MKQGKFCFEVCKPLTRCLTRHKIAFSRILWLEGEEIRLAKYFTLFLVTVCNFQSPRLYVGVIFFVNNR